MDGLSGLIPDTVKTLRAFYKERAQPEQLGQLELEDLNQTRSSLKQHLNVLTEELGEKKAKMQKFWYRLKAIIVHSGEAGFGHYFSFIKIGEEWFCFNDSHVTLKTEEEVLAQAKGQVPGYEQCNCYCLFYERSTQRVTPEKDPKQQNFWALLPENVQDTIIQQIKPKMILRAKEDSLKTPAKDPTEPKKAFERPQFETEDLCEWMRQDYLFQMKSLDERKKVRQSEVSNLLPISNFEDFADVYVCKGISENALIGQIWAT